MGRAEPSLTDICSYIELSTFNSQPPTISMSNKPAIPVKTALVKQFNKEHAQFMAASNKAGPLMVKTFNRARTLGILIKELMGREVITENCVAGWLRDNPGAL